MPSLRSLLQHFLQAPKVVMGPGTGLGQANILWDSSENRYKVWPSGMPTIRKSMDMTVLDSD